MSTQIGGRRHRRQTEARDKTVRCGVLLAAASLVVAIATLVAQVLAGTGVLAGGVPGVRSPAPGDPVEPTPIVRLGAAPRFTCPEAQGSDTEQAETRGDEPVPGQDQGTAATYGPWELDTPVTFTARMVAESSNTTSPTVTVLYDQNGCSVTALLRGTWYIRPEDVPKHRIAMVGHADDPVTSRDVQDELDALDAVEAGWGDEKGLNFDELADAYVAARRTARECQQTCG